MILSAFPPNASSITSIFLVMINSDRATNYNAFETLTRSNNNVYPGGWVGWGEGEDVKPCFPNYHSQSNFYFEVTSNLSERKIDRLVNGVTNVNSKLFACRALICVPSFDRDVRVLLSTNFQSMCDRLQSKPVNV